MQTAESAPSLTTLFSELINGAPRTGGAFVLNSGDGGLLHSLEGISSDEASKSVDGGATIAAHAQHLRYGLSLMNRWGREGGNPFADAMWDAAWKVSRVDDNQWRDIRDGLRDEATRWLQLLSAPRDVTGVELSGMIGSIAHLAYHLGAIRQISKSTRGPKEGQF